MMKFLKKNLFILILFVLCSVFIIRSTSQYLNHLHAREESRIKMIEKCKNEMDQSLDTQFVAYCENVLKQEIHESDFYTMLTDIAVYDLRYLNIFAFLFLVLPSLLSICSYFRENSAKNMLLRESYGSYMKKIIKKYYRYVWFLPALAILLLGICAFNTSLDPSYGIINSTSLWNPTLMHQPFLFFVLYVLNIFFYSIFYLNIGLIALRKHHNFFVSILLSFLLFLGIELFLELVLSGIVFGTIFHSDFGIVFNIMNIFTFLDSYGYIVTVLLGFLWAFLSSLVVYRIYRKKELFVIDCEKNR